MYPSNQTQTNHPVVFEKLEYHLPSQPNLRNCFYYLNQKGRVTSGKCLNNQTLFHSWCLGQRKKILLNYGIMMSKKIKEGSK